MKEETRKRFYGWLAMCSTIVALGQVSILFGWKAVSIAFAASVASYIKGFMDA